MNTYVTPTVMSASFTCPHCGAFAMQNWWIRSWNESVPNERAANQIRVGRCQHCGKSTLWVMDKMVYPDIGNAPFPNSEMPEAVKNTYLEAASIASKSPRGAAAILRLGIQVLCKDLGEPGKDINKDIASLVKKGLPEIVQQSLDIVRVTGNDAVHPGQIDTDDIEVVSKLFDLTNVIIEYMIALPNKVSGIYSQLPAGKKKAIEDRDSPKP